MSRYIVAPSAKLDLKAINLYLGRFSPVAVRQINHKIKQQFKRLADFPNMGQSCNQLSEGLRRFPIEDYLIFYRPISNGVEIVRVVSGYRNIEAVFADEVTFEEE
ncbi:type II toxin-antitoxin system RelE/ParE family toxin [Planktothrix agardhii]|jgi:toxin ParE1/3/4|uniref:type II toxin-antitoxin system RelE/ParE family toxin n=1 Tax=Planktothrix agardhii TaxID=1160 RepID=UPI002876D091|nr:type II toxin-antitoxin system RelE/ParE family toxin [Planktothrix agardhii]MDS1347688.1 type II toxin-antitoxin system RelE/ParE family toxin [Planktothrix agardhii NRERC-751]